MTDAVQLIILGIVQGLTEFLPISSSGHLVIFQKLLNVKSFENTGTVIEVALHLGTLGAVFIYYRKDIADIVRSLFSRSMCAESKSENRNLLKWIIIGTVPAAVLGLLFKDWLESCFKNPILVGAALVTTGSFCIITRFVPRGQKEASKLGFFRTLAIGLAQSIAMIPGISRSGATIFTAICLKVSPRQAGRYSFLLSIPAVCGAVLLKIKDVVKEDALNEVMVIPIILGVLGAALVGLLCLGILTRILKAGNFFYFGFYCIPLGLFMIYYFI